MNIHGIGEETSLTRGMEALADGFPSLASMGAMLRDGRCTSVDLTRYALERIRTLDEHLHAFVAVYADEALLSAKGADVLLEAGCPLGPLHGIPIALKDNIDVKGRPSTAGSMSRATAVASSNAWITNRLRECGAIIVGKTHMVEFAMGAWGANELMGSPRNPWGQYEHLSPGGSSSGSAVAVAAGMVPLSIGTDTGASVRVPAAMCGLTGFKPTIGALSAEGVIPLSTTHDSVGILAQTADDASLTFAALKADESAVRTGSLRTSARLSLDGLRVGYLGEADLEGVQGEVADAYARAMQIFREQGAQLRELAFPTTFEDFASLASMIVLSEVAASWGHVGQDEALAIAPSIRANLVAGFKMSAVDYVRALRRRSELKKKFALALGDLDVFLTPTSPWTARPLSGVDHKKTPVKYSRVINLLDLCGVSVQMGVDHQELPIGLQIAGQTNEDARILHAARAFQSCTSWHDRRWKSP